MYLSDLIIAICFAIALALFFYLYFKFDKPKDVGTLVIDTSDPDGPYMFLELDVDPRTIINKKHVTLRINDRF